MDLSVFCKLTRMTLTMQTSILRLSISRKLFGFVYRLLSITKGSCSSNFCFWVGFYQTSTFSIGAQAPVHWKVHFKKSSFLGFYPTLQIPYTPKVERMEPDGFPKPGFQVPSETSGRQKNLFKKLQEESQKVYPSPKRQDSSTINPSPPSPTSPVYRLATNSAAPKANGEQSGDSWRQTANYCPPGNDHTSPPNAKFGKSSTQMIQFHAFLGDMMLIPWEGNGSKNLRNAEKKNTVPWVRDLGNLGILVKKKKNILES